MSGLHLLRIGLGALSYVAFLPLTGGLIATGEKGVLRETAGRYVFLTLLDLPVLAYLAISLWMDHWARIAVPPLFAMAVTAAIAEMLRRDRSSTAAIGILGVPVITTLLLPIALGIVALLT